MDTLHYNKRIAQFMEVHLWKGVYDLPQHHYYTILSRYKDEYTPSELRYHKDWNWLMPVIYKIVNTEEYRGMEERELIMDIVPFGNITDTYQAVTVFLDKLLEMKREKEKTAIC